MKCLIREVALLSLTLSVAIGVLSFGCTKETAISTLPANVAILSANQAEKVRELCTRAPPLRVTGFREVEQHEALAAESKIARFISRHAPSEVADRLGDYKRQYVGLFVDGQPVLYINAFLELDGPVPGWRTTFAEFCDGGTTAWGLVYDVGRGRFEHLEINEEL